MSNELATLSKELAKAVEQAGQYVAAVHARPRFPSSGVFWRPGVIVTAEHTIRREEEIAVTLPNGTNAQATLAGTDPGTDLAVLRVEGAGQPAGACEHALQIEQRGLALVHADDLRWLIVRDLAAQF